MASHRVERVSEAIREVVAIAIIRDVADPRIHGVTVLNVEVSADLRQATVFVSSGRQASDPVHTSVEIQG